MFVSGILNLNLRNGDHLVALFVSANIANMYMQPSHAKSVRRDARSRYSCTYASINPDPPPPHPHPAVPLFPSPPLLSPSPYPPSRFTHPVISVLTKADCVYHEPKKQSHDLANFHHICSSKQHASV